VAALDRFLAELPTPSLRGNAAPASLWDTINALPPLKRYRVDPYVAAAAALQAAGKDPAVAALADYAGVYDRDEQKKVMLLSRLLFRARPGPGRGRRTAGPA
jgi:hypothetical protein